MTRRVSLVTIGGATKSHERYDEQRARARQQSADASRAWRSRRYSENHAWIAGYKAHVGCKECGERNPICLDLHHRNPATKIGAVSVMAASEPLLVVVREIAQCDVLCANCHRKQHAANGLKHTAIKVLTIGDLEMIEIARALVVDRE